MALPGAVVAAPIGLGEASSFSVLAGSTVTNVGPSVIDGNVGVSPGLAVVGFPPAQLVGASLFYSGAPSATPQLDLTTAYNQAAAAIKGLKALAPELRFQLGKAVRMRHVPELHFHYEDSVDKGERIDALLRENPPSEDDA